MAGFNKSLYHETPTVIQWLSAHPMLHCTNKLNTIQTKNDLVWETSCFTGELKTLIMRAPQRDTEATPSRLKLRLCCTWEKIKVITHKIVTLCWSVACRAVKWSDFSLEFDFGFLLWNDDHGTKLKLCARQTEHKSTSSTSWITAVLWRFPELVCTSNTVLRHI